MKFKTTKKEMKENYSRIIKLGYCSAQNLLRYLDPIAYSSGRDGWSCDYYDVKSVLISTGYQPIGNIEPDYELLKEYDDKAHQAAFNNSIDYEQRKTEVTRLLYEYIFKTVFKTDKKAI